MIESVISNHFKSKNTHAAELAAEPCRSRGRRSAPSLGRRLVLALPLALWVSGVAAPAYFPSPLVALAMAADALASTKVGDLSIKLIKESEGSYLVSLSAGSPVEPSMLVVENPLRFVIDVPGIGSRASQTVAVHDAEIGALRVGSHPDKTRIVLDLKGSAAPQYSAVPGASGTKILVSFTGQAPRADTVAAADEEPVPPPAPKRSPVPAPTKPPSAKASPGPHEDIERRIDELLSEKNGGHRTPDAAGTEHPGTGGERAGRGKAPPPGRGEKASAAFPAAGEEFDNPPEKDPGAEDGAEEPAPSRGGKSPGGGRTEPGRTDSAKGEGSRAEPLTGTGSSVVRALYYQTTNNTTVAALAIDLDKLDDFTLNRTAPDLYELTIQNARLAGPYLRLAQFPPDSFKGFSVVMAEERGSTVVVKIFVEENTKLFPFTSKNQLWLRVGQ